MPGGKRAILEAIAGIVAGRLFGFAALTEALDVVDTWIKGEAHLRSLGLEYLLGVGAFALLCAVAATTRNLKFHVLFAFGAVLYEISFFARNYGTLN